MVSTVDKQRRNNGQREAADEPAKRQHLSTIPPRLSHLLASRESVKFRPSLPTAFRLNLITGMFRPPREHLSPPSGCALTFRVVRSLLWTLNRRDTYPPPMPRREQGKTTVARHTAKNRAAERDHYACQIAANEEHLRTGLTAFYCTP